MVSSAHCSFDQPSPHRTDRHEALATFAASAAIILSIIQMYATRLGAGLHEKDIDPNNMELLLKVCHFGLVIHIAPTNSICVSWSWQPYSFTSPSTGP
jgi:hypothetical protein